MRALLGVLLSNAVMQIGAIHLHSQLPADGEAATYYWPEPRGRPESYSISRWTGPRNLTGKTLAWSWFNGGPEGKYRASAHSGVVIDDHKSIYLASTDGIRKFSSDGELLWHAPMSTWRIPTLSSGRVLVTSNSGEVIALSMATGERLWVSKFTTALGTDISGVAVRDGVLLAESAGNPGGGAGKVAGLDPTDGHVLWEFQPFSQLWNFMPMEAGNGSIIFQDQIGGVYRLRTKDGKLLWHSGYSGAWDADMTDGLAMVTDGMVYAVHSDGPCCASDQKANLRAYDLSSGQEIWKQDFPYPANSQPVVARLGKGDGLSERLAVVMPIGAQPLPGQKGKEWRSSIVSYDAKTGRPLWAWDPPAWHSELVAGDLQRIIHGTICLPNPYGSPSVDASGTLYMGHYNGMIYAIRDDNGDGQIDDAEVSKFDTGAGFSHGGAALAPGMLVIPSCDGLYVFKE